MEKTCIKCGHINPEATGAATDGCPKCGVIYAKAQLSPEPVRRRSSVSASVDSTYTPFIDELRERSIYPTFRSVINIGYVLGLVVAVLLFLGGLIGGYNTRSPGTTLGAVFAAIVIIVVSRFMKEASLMLADMSDATVLMAKRSAE